MNNDIETAIQTVRNAIGFAPSGMNRPAGDALRRIESEFDPNSENSVAFALHDTLARLQAAEEEREGDKATLNAIAALLNLEEGQTGWDAIVSLQARLHAAEKVILDDAQASIRDAETVKGLAAERDRLSLELIEYDALVAGIEALVEKWRAMKRPDERMGAEDALVLGAHLCADELEALTKPVPTEEDDRLEPGVARWVGRRMAGIPVVPCDGTCPERRYCVEHGDLVPPTNPLMDRTTP